MGYYCIILDEENSTYIIEDDLRIFHILLTSEDEYY